MVFFDIVDGLYASEEQYSKCVSHIIACILVHHLVWNTFHQTVVSQSFPGEKFPLEKVNEAMAASGKSGKKGKVLLEG